MADQNIDTQLMSIISGKLMFDQKYVKYKIDDNGNLLVDAHGKPLPPSEILNKLTEEEKEILIKEAEEAKKIINEDNASFSTMMKTSFSNIKGNVAAGLTKVGTAASDVLSKFPFGSKKPEIVEGGKRKSRKQKKSKKSKKNKSKKSKK